MSAEHGTPGKPNAPVRAAPGAFPMAARHVGPDVCGGHDLDHQRPCRDPMSWATLAIGGVDSHVHHSWMPLQGRDWECA